ncbi:hypothetical protein NFI96_029061 [Prochilodus magdalenae]|nr:hypothetical protein NFI96_029061 [Prochilodus magdalenae]
MWQGLRHITDYQQRSREVTTSHTTLPDQLNEFYARFEALNPDRQRGVMAEGSTQNSSLTVTSVEVCKALRRINPRKAAGPDNIPGRALKVCSSELAGVFVDIFNLSLAQSSVPSCFKTTTIVPLPKKSVVTCLNDYRPVALTPIVMKCFERIVMSHIQETIPDNLDPLQFAYRQNRSTDDAVNTAIHTALTHLEGKDTYVRMLFIDYRSAFNTVIPTKLAGKLLTLGLTPTLCNWVLNFLTDRPQSVRIGSRTSSTRTVSTGTPQGCVLSPLLYTLFTYDCVASQSNTSIIKFADDTTVIGLITGGDETAYRREVAELVDWCDYNNLSLNTDKTKEMIVDPRRRRRELHTPLFIGGTEVERVKTFKFLGVHISKDLTCNFYRSTIESVLTSSITVWYGNCTAQDRKALQRVIKTAQLISGAAFPSLQDIYRTRAPGEPVSAADLQAPTWHGFRNTNKHTGNDRPVYAEVRFTQGRLQWIATSAYSVERFCGAAFRFSAARGDQGSHFNINIELFIQERNHNLVCTTRTGGGGGEDRAVEEERTEGEQEEDWMEE